MGGTDGAQRSPIVEANSCDVAGVRVAGTAEVAYVQLPERYVAGTEVVVDPCNYESTSA